MPKVIHFSLPTQRWHFVSDKLLREQLQQDYLELRHLIDARAEKSIVVLCGSMLEAALISVLSSQRPAAEQAHQRLFNKKEAFDRWGLNDLIEVAADLKLLRANRLQFAAHSVRHFRNLIHPMAAQRSQVPLTHNDTLGVLSFFVAIIDSLANPPDLDPRDRFFTAVERVGGADAADMARQMVLWCEAQSLESVWTKPGTYLPQVKGRTGTYSPIGIRPNGKFIVRFQYLKRVAPAYKVRDRRTDLARRLALATQGAILQSKVDAIQIFPIGRLARPGVLSATQVVLQDLFRKLSA